MVGSYEWIILLVGFLGLLVWELVRVRRSIRTARDDAQPSQPPDQPPTQ